MTKSKAVMQQEKARRYSRQLNEDLRQAFAQLPTDILPRTVNVRDIDDDELDFPYKLVYGGFEVATLAFKRNESVPDPPMETKPPMQAIFRCR